MTKEEILQKHYPDFDISSGWMFDGSVSSVFDAMEEYAKHQSVLFFQWNANQVSEYIDYLNRALTVDGNTEKEKELNYFENGTIQDRYAQFIEHQKQNNG